MRCEYKGDPMDALLVVDFQNDFTPGGALPVEHGDEIADPINAIADRFEFVVATRDWHPPDHGSFEGVEVDAEKWHGIDPPGIWPVHCVQGTPGAELHPSLDRSKLDHVVDKAQDRYTQGYSSFHGGNLAEVLRERGVDHVYVAGLATDYCVKNTVLDAVREGLEVTVVKDAIRGIDVKPGDSERAIEEMVRAGADLVSAADLLERAPAQRS
jgi:nicotinamidase/pyrazinamidase